MQNLIAEMARFGVTSADVSAAINCTEKTVQNKIAGRSQFSVREALEIRDTFFPNMKIEYLFSQSADRAG